MTALDRTFNRCRGKMFCRDDGEKCLVCGRTLEEIAKTKALIADTAQAAVDLGYANFQEFLDYLAEKASKKIEYETGSASVGTGSA